MSKNIENRIIDYIKKSPFGATSSEIAKFLGINRVTITKYLAIIREKAKIDFKQFGMAKLWYIPVDINQLRFLRELILGVCEKVDSKQMKDALEKTAHQIAKDISQLYRNFHGTNKLSKSQLIDSIMDAFNKLGANFSLVSETDEKITFRNTKCLFGTNIKKCPMLCTTTSVIIGTITADNLGYGQVELTKTIANKHSEDIITVYLKK